MIEIEIDGKKVVADDGSTIIEAADTVGINIPRFCYHKKLSIAANCRMCLVDVENSRKALPACATPVTPGMKIFTHSKDAVKAQKSVMEYLLVNHPLDCPICDQGGECELQDLSMGYGMGQSCSNQTKRSVAVDDIGPLIDVGGMTRCIHCTRCVRFGDEIAGLRELGVCNRGGHEEISTYLPHIMRSEVSGNIIDLCPVGALTSKPFKFQARSWELTEKPSIAAHDCWGSNIYCHVRDRSEKESQQLMRVVPMVNEAINENWLSDRDRFAYQGLSHKDRLLEPAAHRARSWQKVTWQQALPDMLDKLKQVVDEHGVDEVCVVASPNISTESAYAISQVMQGFGIKNTDYRARRLDFSSKASRANLYGFAKPIEYIEQCDRLLLIGANVRQEQPLAALRMRKAEQNGAVIHSIDSYKHDFNFKAEGHIQHPQQWLCSLAYMINAANKKGINLPTDMHYPQDFAELGLDDTSSSIVDSILEGEQKIIWLGTGVYHHPNSVTIVALARTLAAMLDCEVAVMKDGANVGGMHLSGLAPHINVGGNLMEEPGVDLHTCLEKPRKAYIFFGLDPEYDFAESSLICSAVEKAQLVVAFSAFSSDFLQVHADYMFPITSTAEESGSLINITGQKQYFHQALDGPGSSKPIWKIMHQIARLNAMPCVDDISSIESIDSILDPIYKISLEASLDTPDIDIESIELNPVCDLYWRVGPWAMYRIDAQVRRAASLQAVQSKLINQDAIIMHSKTADKLSSKQVAITYYDEVREFSVITDDNLAPGCLLLPSGLETVAAWGTAAGSIQVEGATND
jgi:NADH-quinone oxidoreductase subunit G